MSTAPRARVQIRGRNIIIKESSQVKWGNVTVLLNEITLQPQLDENGFKKITLETTEMIDVLTTFEASGDEVFLCLGWVIWFGLFVIA